MPEGGRSQSRGKKKLRKQGDLYLLYIYIYKLLSNTIDASCEGGTAGASRHDSCQRSKRALAKSSVGGISYCQEDPPPKETLRKEISVV